MKTTRLPLLTAALCLAGCATTHYGCPAPDGVTCMSAAEVYEATNHADRVQGKAAPRQERRGAMTTSPGTRRDVVVIDNGSLTLTEEASPVESLPKELPLRSPARVMRIWFSPWEDASGDLHMAGHLFTEIEPRRWTVGQKAPDTAFSLQRLEPLSAPPGKSDAANTETPESSHADSSSAPQGRTERPTTSKTETPSTTP